MNTMLEWERLADGAEIADYNGARGLRTVSVEWDANADDAGSPPVRWEVWGDDDQYPEARGWAVTYEAARIVAERIAPVLAN